MEKEILDILEDILEIEGLERDFVLDEETWDSLNVISFIAAVNTKFGKVLEAEQTSTASSISELIEMVNS